MKPVVVHQEEEAVVIVIETILAQLGLIVLMEHVFVNSQENMVKIVLIDHANHLTYVEQQQGNALPCFHLRQ